MQHIQGIAIDAARSNVDHHYLYICDAYNSFMQTHTAQVTLIIRLPCAKFSSVLLVFVHAWAVFITSLARNCVVLAVLPCCLTCSQLLNIKNCGRRCSPPG